MHEGDHPDPSERLSADDMATQREAQFLSAALRRQAVAAASGGPAVARGVCVNCGQACGPAARYCDDECRADHEARQRVLARQGRG